MRHVLKVRALDERYTFGPYLNTVREAFKEHRLQIEPFEFRGPDTWENDRGMTHAEIFNVLVDHVAKIFSTKTFREDLRSQERNANRNEIAGLLLEAKAFEDERQCLVLTMHFGYDEQHRSRATLQQLQQDRKRFFNNRRSNEVLREIVKYIWTVEHGDETGLHLSVIFICHLCARSESGLAEFIGSYWNKLTAEKGAWWPSNVERIISDKKYIYIRCSGLVDRDDEEKRKALRMTIRFTAQKNLFLKLVGDTRFKQFGTSALLPNRQSPSHDVVVSSNMGTA
ncbi:hypothetical protein GCM10007242_27840 [Pigmentiphaga litoralis]|nr:hypothetical protein GCM10007242_27840 [Pigmentiphaga litoralis]